MGRKTGLQLSVLAHPPTEVGDTYREINHSIGDAEKNSRKKMHCGISVLMCRPRLREVQSGHCTEAPSTSPVPLHQPCPQQATRSRAGVGPGARELVTPAQLLQKTKPGQGGDNKHLNQQSLP